MPIPPPLPTPAMLSAAQRKVLRALARGEQPFVAPVTRHWLVRHGLVTADRTGRRPSGVPIKWFVLTLTDAGRKLVEEL